MPTISRYSISAAVVLAWGCILASAPSAMADLTPGGGAQESSDPPESAGDASDDGTLSARVSGGVVFDRSGNGTGSHTGAVTATGASWTPPACWYAPKYTAPQLKKEREHTWGLDSTGPEFDNQERERYVKGHPYKNFNMDKADEGYWWDSYANEGFPPGWDSCDKPIFWVDKGDPPPADVPEAVTPEILAKLAYAEIRVPGTEVSLSPENNTKVNLPTWAWLDGARFKPVSVSASVPVLGIKATTTAEPVSLKLEAGTQDATLHPASGECPIENGRIGTPYTKGSAGKTPPCGVTYLRSSGDGTYGLKATITWKIHWTGTGVDGEQPLPDGTFGTTQDIAVGEVQAVNR